MSNQSTVHCGHRGVQLETRECVSCVGKVELKVFGCERHGRCVLGKSTDGLQSCDGCPDRQPKLSIVIPTYDDYEGLSMTLESLAMHHLDNDPELAGMVEIDVIEQNPGDAPGPGFERHTCRKHATLTASLTGSIGQRYSCRLIPYTEKIGPGNAKDFGARNARGEYVLVLDCHVLLRTGAVRRLVEWLDVNTEFHGLIHGPRYDDGRLAVSTHMSLRPGSHLNDTWKYTPVARYDFDGPAVEIPCHGMGLFACRKVDWLGFSPAFTGFGCEEGYIHAKYRLAGEPVVCLPALAWWHRFGRPNGAPYPVTWIDRVNNALSGCVEMALPVEPVRERYQKHVGKEQFDAKLAELRATLPARPSSVILTSYLTGTPDPQRGESVKPDDDERMTLAKSAIRHGQKVVIFHDQLSDAFTRNWSNYLCEFVKVETHPELSCNDARFGYFHDWLQDHEVDQVWINDLFDVRVGSDPVKYFEQAPGKALHVGTHYHGETLYRFKEGSPTYGTHERWLQQIYGGVPSFLAGWPILMAGTWGGARQHVLRALELLTTEIAATAPKKRNSNLTAFNVICYRDFGAENLHTPGFPLVSEFGKHQHDSKAVWIHK